MNRVVVDTDVVSFLFKRSPYWKPVRSRARGAHSTHLVYDRRRAGTLGDPAQLERTAPALVPCALAAIYGCTVKPGSCRAWADATVAAQAAGRCIECADAWIAATAVLYDAPLITHNRADYLGVPSLIVISHRK